MKSGSGISTPEWKMSEKSRQRTQWRTYSPRITCQNGVALGLKRGTTIFERTEAGRLLLPLGVKRIPSNKIQRNSLGKQIVHHHIEKPALSCGQHVPKLGWCVAKEFAEMERQPRQHVIVVA